MRIRLFSSHLCNSKHHRSTAGKRKSVDSKELQEALLTQSSAVVVEGLIRHSLSKLRLSDLIAWDTVPVSLFHFDSLFLILQAKSFFFYPSQ